MFTTPSFGFLGAAAFSATAQVANAIPSIFLEHSAQAALVICLLYAVNNLWKRNTAMTKEMRDLTAHFHEEIRTEMQRQIDQERKSRKEQTEAVRELAQLLKDLRSQRDHE